MQDARFIETPGYLFQWFLARPLPRLLYSQWQDSESRLHYKDAALGKESGRKTRVDVLRPPAVL